MSILDTPELLKTVLEFLRVTVARHLIYWSASLGDVGFIEEAQRRASSGRVNTGEDPESLVHVVPAEPHERFANIHDDRMSIGDHLKDGRAAVISHDLHPILGSGGENSLSGVNRSLVEI